MVVNGATQFIGSRIREVMTGIGEAAHAPKTNVVVAPKTPDENLMRQFTVSAEKLVGLTSGDNRGGLACNCREGSAFGSESR